MSPIFREMGEALRPLLRDVVTPLAIESPKGWVQHGTGTLLAVADSYFIVSASHVFEQAQTAKLPLCGSGNSSRPECDLSPDGHLTAFLRNHCCPFASPSCVKPRKTGCHTLWYTLSDGQRSSYR